MKTMLLTRGGITTALITLILFADQGFATDQWPS
jgi:hypothetical protein